jgi:hypothetical protein
MSVPERPGGVGGCLGGNCAPHRDAQEPRAAQPIRAPCLLALSDAPSGRRWFHIALPPGPPGCPATAPNQASKSETQIPALRSCCPVQSPPPPGAGTLIWIPEPDLPEHDWLLPPPQIKPPNQKPGFPVTIRPRRPTRDAARSPPCVASTVRLFSRRGSQDGSDARSVSELQRGVRVGADVCRPQAAV